MEKSTMENFLKYAHGSFAFMYVYGRVADDGVPDSC